MTKIVEIKRDHFIKIYDLTLSNPTKADFTYPESKIRNSLSLGPSLEYSPEPSGLERTKRAISAYYQEQNHSLALSQIVVTASTSEAYSYLFRLLANPGDEVLVPQPCYPLFEFLTALDSVNPIPYRLKYEEKWHIDLDSIKSSISPRTKAILIVNPNNPTGSFVNAQEKEYLQKLSLNSRIPLIVDEVFIDYPFESRGDQRLSFNVKNGFLTFTVSGLSKVSALPQMKLSWIVISGSEKVRAEAFRKLEILADMYLSVSTPVQHGVQDFLEIRYPLQNQIKTRIKKNLQQLKSDLAQTTARVLHVEGGWYGIIRLPTSHTDEEWALDILEKSNVLFHPGYFYDIQEESHLVCSLLTKPEVFREGLKRCKNFLNEIQDPKFGRK